MLKLIVSLAVAYMPGLYRQLIQRDLNKWRIFRDRTNPRDLFSDREFCHRFGFEKTSIYDLVEFIGPELFMLTERHFAAPDLICLWIVLRFLGSGVKYDDIGDTAGLVKSTVCEILKELIPHIASKHREMIKFPKDTNELLFIKCGFYKKRGI